VSQRQAPNPFDDIPDLVPAPPVARPAPQAAPVSALPPIEAPSAKQSDPPGPIDFGAAFDLDVPRAAPVPAFTPSQQPGPPSGAPPHALPSQAPHGLQSHAPQAQSYKPPIAPSSSPGRPTPGHGGPAVPQAPSSYSGFAPSSDPGLRIEGEAPQSQRAPIVTREQIQDAARRAGEVSREVAGKVADKTREVAVAAAFRSIGHNQEKSIRIEDPSTWIKPMLGPIVALAIAIVITIVAIAGAIAWLRYVAIVCVLGAIGFGVARWFKLQADN